MQTNFRFNLNSLKGFDQNRKIWVMDTSHHHILNAILNETNDGFLTAKDYNGDRTCFISPIVTNNGKEGFGDNTFNQYIRILIFFGIVDYKILIENNIKNWKNFNEYIIKNGIEIKPYKDFKEYLSKNVSNIAKNIKEILLLDNFISKDANNILSTIEFFLNYKDSAEEISVPEIVEYFKNYSLGISQLKSNSDINSIHGEFSIYIKLIEFYERLIYELMGISVDAIEDPFDFQLDFEGYGYLGELIINFLLRDRYNEIDWVSKRDKRSNHDFKADGDYIEVKTSATKKAKVAFNLSWNEYVLQQNNKDNYYIYYVDGLYNVKEPEKTIMKFLNNMEEFVKQNNIKIEIIDSRMLKKYEMVSKGYWISELK